MPECSPCSGQSASTPTGGTSCQPGPRGPRGNPGSTGAAGANGNHAYGVVAGGAAVVPNPGELWSLVLDNNDWVGTGQIIYIEDIGYFIASSVGNTSILISNPAYAGNAAPGTAIPVGAVVSPGGPKGASAPSDTMGYILLRRELGSGVNGGTFTSGSWQARLLNTTAEDTLGQVLALDSSTGVFQIQAGKYQFRSEAPAFDVNRHRARLRNITNPESFYGTSEFTGDNGQTNSVVIGTVDLAVDTEFILESRCQTTRATNGFGVASNFGTEVEAYEFIEFKQVP